MVVGDDDVTVKRKTAKKQSNGRNNVSDDLAAGSYDDGATTRRGRFRVSAPPTGPPETTVGRFRLIPQAGTYGPTSPFLQRGRFSVIPEEPQNSPSASAITPPIITTTAADRQASPDWDFDDDKSHVLQQTDDDATDALTEDRVRMWGRHCWRLYCAQSSTVDDEDRRGYDFVMPIIGCFGWNAIIPKSSTAKT
uniref:Uncharacterized protein n=1 Tax=Anopheles albimanus TaxID=7167 RepID=A0A182F852_ANOAL